VSWLKSIFGGKAPRAVMVQPSGTAFEVSDGQTVLESALKQGLAYPHDCTVGTCGTCRTKLLSGKVDAITPFGYTLSREELEAGYILACQALPKTDLEVEVDLSATDLAHVETTARIAAITPLTHDIVQVEWEAEAPMPYLAGQYVNISWEGAPAHRSYSFATAPDPAGSTRLTSYIRHVPGGAFTDLLFGGGAQPLAFGLDGPHGTFWLRESKGPMLCIAGGSGLAPLMSLLQDAAKRRVRRDCVLLFGGRAKRDLYGEAEISAIRSAWTAGFDYWPVLSETPETGIREGMVTAHIAAALERLGPDAQAYLCGPPPMIDAAIAELGRLGVPMDAIFYDKFTDASTGGGV
jgi:p-cymene methyl-monooxygenase electron transfer component